MSDPGAGPANPHGPANASQAGPLVGAGEAAVCSDAAACGSASRQSHHARELIRRQRIGRESGGRPPAYIGPMPERPWEDEYTLLCERCGYVIEGLETAGACPECGKPIAESLPERRVGTAWQQGPSVANLRATALMTLRDPLATLDTIKFGPSNSKRLSFRYSVIAGYTLAYGACLLVTFHPGFGPLGGWEIQPLWYAGYIMSAIFGAILVLPFAGVFELLTHVERRGLQYFSSRRGGRVSKDVAREICAHGAVGWALGGAGFSGSIVLASLLFVGSGKPTLMPIGFLLGISFLLAGFLFFEVFAWLGLRRCKFANRVRPASTIES